MDQYEEKKWFVFVVDHHEGPFSEVEMRGKMESRAIGLSNYVWSDGMDDWRVMSEIPAFGSVPAPAPQQRQEGPVEKKSEGPAIKFAPSDAVEKHKTTKKQPPKRLEEESADEEKKTAPPKGAAVFALAGVVILVGLGGGAYFFKDRIFPPIPRLETVTQEDYAGLKAAASASVEDQGPAVAVALSRENLQRPVFYLASNLPDGSSFDIHFEGISSTLVGQLHALAKGSAVISKKLGKTAPIALATDKDLPMGEYVIYVTESDAQPDDVKGVLAKLPSLKTTGTAFVPSSNKIFVRKTVFIGGTKDASYTQKLNEFHTKLMEKARLEVAELKQLEAVLESQFQDTTAQFEAMKKSRSKKSAWPKFHEGWMSKEAPLSEPFQKTTPEVFHSDYLHADIYDKLRQVDQDIQKLHGLEDDYFTKKEATKEPANGPLDTQLAEAATTSQAAILELKSEIDKAEKSPSPL